MSAIDSTSEVAIKETVANAISDYHGFIEPYLGGFPEVVANKFSKGDLYSTDEKIIGQWIDGKPLYQKTITATNTIAENTYATIGTISDVDTPVYAYGTAEDHSEGLNYHMLGSIWSGLNFQSSGNVNISTGLYYAYNNTTFTITCLYTKTTDEAIAIGSDTDYSLEEKIIGTWTDGKPLYQKTVDCGTGPNNTSKQVAHNIINIEKCIYQSGLLYDGTYSYPIPNSNTSTYLNGIYVDTSNIMIVTSWNASNCDCYVTLQYTKTS